MNIRRRSQVNLLQDKNGWVTSLENKALSNIIKKLDINITSKKIATFQVCYLPDKYNAIKKYI